MFRDQVYLVGSSNSFLYQGETLSYNTDAAYITFVNTTAPETSACETYSETTLDFSVDYQILGSPEATTVLARAPVLKPVSDPDYPVLTVETTAALETKL